ncbi:ATP-binding protein [Oleiharenicola lentus]|uniref:ATP-binding protein n=1 Tax=Oleiharenicola lentus TaxID=2508720 RepID=UPI003F67BAE5
MSTHTPESVFVTDGFPRLTYVPIEQGRQEAELRDGLDQQNKVISISGPSKSGKTTLCDRMFGSEHGFDQIYVTGDTVTSVHELWREAYRQVTDDTDKPFDEISVTQRLSRIRDSGIPLIIDDFHYIPHSARAEVSMSIKNAAATGLRIICLTVPHRNDDAIRSNPDLSGRYFCVDFRFWEPSDLLRIAETGFPLVGFPNDPHFNMHLAEEALRSPQIMQTLCLEACRMHGKDVALENVVPSHDYIPEIKARTLRSYNYKTSLEKLRSGPPGHGKERKFFRTLEGEEIDLYGCIVRALKQDPPYQKIHLDDIRDRIRTFLVEEADSEPNTRNGLKQYAKLFKDTKPVLDWDDEKRILTVLDPHFFFYLRNENLSK